MSAEPIRTLPAWVYRTPEFYRAERRAIWSREWLLVGHISQLREPGDYVSMRIAGEPIAVVKGADGELRGFSNVCRHRAARILDGAGNCGKAIRCPYHGWTYGLDGRLLAVPEKTGFPGFDRDENGLWPVHVGVASGFVFANLSPEPEPLEAALGPFSEWLAPYRPERLVRYQSGSSVLPINWKNSIDNFLEGYHVPVGHPGLLRLLDYKNYLVETSDANVSIARSPMRDKPSRDRRERLYQRLVRPMPGLRAPESEQWNFVFALPGHDGQPLPRPDRLLAQLPARRAAHAHDLERVPAARDVGPPRPAGAEAQLPHQPPRAGGGQRAHRARPAGARVEPLPGRRDRRARERHQALPRPHPRGDPRRGGRRRGRRHLRLARSGAGMIGSPRGRDR